MPTHPEPPGPGRPSLALIGAPVDIGAGRRGCAMGPAALRIAELTRALADLGLAVTDRGDVAPDPPCPDIADHPEFARAPAAAAIAGWLRAIDRATAAAFRDGALPILLGGDHALSMGSVNAAARAARDAGRPLFVLWLDAHADFNTPATSPSGNMHGMSTAFLCGDPGFDGLLPDRVPIDPSRLHLLGIRSIDREERELLAGRGVDVADMRLVDEWGVAVLLGRVLDRVAAAGGHLHVSLDVDFLDPTIAPGGGTLVRGGATFREAHLAMEILADSGLVTSLDLAELNPFLDERGTTALLLVDLVASLFGRRVVDRPTAAARAGRLTKAP